MTTIDMKNVLCGLCGGRVDIFIILSTNTFGSADLDFRPPEMERSTIDTWVLRCPYCGYCSADIQSTPQGAQSMVNSQVYKDQLNNLYYPELANSFLCKSILDQGLNNVVGMTWVLIHAAWACDDEEGYKEQAIICREKAVKTLYLAEENHQMVTDECDVTTALLADLLRRSGQLQNADKVIKARKSSAVDENVAHILDYQIMLINRNDLSCHKISEAFADKV